MKKKILLTISASVLALILGLGIYHTNASQQDPKLSFEDIRQLVETQYPGEITEIELEKDFNQVVYEVEIEGNGKKYELKIEGNSGEVLKIKEKLKADKNPVEINEHDDDDNMDRHEVKKATDKQQSNNKEQDDKKSKAKNKKTDQKQNQDKKAVISVAEATEIALKEFPGYVIEVELDEDDGRLIYEIEIKSGDKEAEFEIDAITGKILMIDIDD